jgi:peptidoglycan/xylan/chitin deacetylase (PgdA/CDA1 family)
MKKDHIVLLMHDNMFRSLRGNRPKLERLIEALSNEGHSFAFISGFDRTIGDQRA